MLTSDFKVHRTEGLRVVDASVFPRAPGLFIVSAIYMMARRRLTSSSRTPNGTRKSVNQTVGSSLCACERPHHTGVFSLSHLSRHAVVTISEMPWPK